MQTSLAEFGRKEWKKLFALENLFDFSKQLLIYRWSVQSKFWSKISPKIKFNAEIKLKNQEALRFKKVIFKVLWETVARPSFEFNLADDILKYDR